MEINLKSEFDSKEIDNLERQIKQRQGEIEMLRSAIKHYRNLCKHEGMQSYRDYDGGSSSHCYKCGYGN